MIRCRECRWPGECDEMHKCKLALGEVVSSKDEIIQEAALKEARETWPAFNDPHQGHERSAFMAGVRFALARSAPETEAECEPLAWAAKNGDVITADERRRTNYPGRLDFYCIPLYPRPAQKTNGDPT